MSSKQTSTWFLIGIGTIAAYLSYRIAEPFLSPLFIATVLGIVFFPMHSRLNARIRQPNAAAVLSTFLVIFVMAIPALLLGIVASRELRTTYEYLSAKSVAEGGIAPYVKHMLEAPVRVIGRYVDLTAVNLRSTVLGWAEQASRYLLGLGAKAAGNLIDFVLGISAVFFTLFFLFRDGPEICRQITAAMPLPQEKSAHLMTRTYDAITASAFGVVAVALVQGILKGLGFWALGFSAPVLWGIANALSSLIPVVGTALVWIPAEIVLLLGGHWIKALILLGLEAGCAVLIDTAIRPRLISGRTRIPSLLLFFALLGGVKEFGFTGVFIGPVVVAVTMAVWDLLREHAGSEPPIAVQPPASSTFLNKIEQTVDRIIDSKLKSTESPS